MKKALSLVSFLKEKIRENNLIILLCDFDGTLSTIVADPEQAYIQPEIRLSLQKFKNENTFLGFISGRDIKDLKERVDLNNVIYAGDHGMHINYFGKDYIPSNKLIVFKETKNNCFQNIKDKLKKFTGVYLEDKEFNISIHYRNLSLENIDSFKNITNKLINKYKGFFKVTYGKKLIEFRPPINWNKGNAVQWIKNKILLETKKDNYFIIYIGDDITDEDVFSSFNLKHEIGIKVLSPENKAETAANYYLNSVDEAAVFLSELSNYKL